MQLSVFWIKGTLPALVARQKMALSISLCTRDVYISQTGVILVQKSLLESVVVYFQVT